jgi:hypothetical protein
MENVNIVEDRCHTFTGFPLRRKISSSTRRALSRLLAQLCLPFPSTLTLYCLLSLCSILPLSPVYTNTWTYKSTTVFTSNRILSIKSKPSFQRLPLSFLQPTTNTSWCIIRSVTLTLFPPSLSLTSSHQCWTGLDPTFHIPLGSLWDIKRVIDPTVLLPSLCFATMLDMRQSRSVRPFL